MTPDKLKIVFFGTPEFAAASLRALVEGGFNVCAVVTSVDKPAGRGHKLLQSDVKKYAVEAGLPVLQPANLKNPEFQAELKSFDADLFIVIAFRMLPESVWNMPPLGTFNLHASLLPRYRGAAPINRAIMNGETRTGVTAFFLNGQIDTGDLFASEATDILPEDNAGTLHDRLMDIAARMVTKAVTDIAEGNFHREPQPEESPVGAPKIFHNDCLVDWTLPSARIHNHIRGLSPYPAARGILIDENGTETECKLFASVISSLTLAPGVLKTDNGKMIAGTGDGAIEILELQPAGKRRMKTEDFLRGYSPVRFKA